MKNFIFVFVLLFHSCGCFEYTYVRDADGDGYEDSRLDLDLVKKFTIVNHTNKTYTNNVIYSVYAEKKKEKNPTWKIYYFSKKYKLGKNEYYSFHKIKMIKYQEKIKKENGKDLKVSANGCRGEYLDYGGGFFVFSLDEGRKKVFFGHRDYLSKQIWGEGTSDCKRYYTWDIHPVWQEKELTIHIHNDKITFSDPKIKEVKKVTASKSKEEIELKNLEIVPCDEE